MPPTQRVIRAILLDEFSGVDALNCTEIAALLNLDAAQTNQMIAELDNIGLAQFVADQGAVLKPFGPQDLLEILHIRGVLVAEATRLACPRIPRESLDVVRTIGVNLMDRGNLDDAAAAQSVADLDRQFYELIARFCGTRLLFLEMSRFDVLMQVVRDIRRERHRGLRDGLLESMRVMEHLLAGDSNLASSMMTEHLRKMARRDIEAIYGPSARDVILDGASTASL
jgi:DNA-binding GntR family transcriptional regulator